MSADGNVCIGSGAWLGGWAWQDVATRLRAKGHDVYPVTLTGLGERVHLARPEVDLETHIADVVNTIEWNDLDDVILAGHSYAGIVVTGVADRIPDRIQQLVYVDSAPFADGMAMTDLYPPDALAALRQTVDESGEGWRWPFPGFELLAEDASVAGLGRRSGQRLRPELYHSHGRRTPSRSVSSRRTPGTRRRTGVAIACDDMRSMVAAGVPQIAALTAPPWHYLELETGHWPMFSVPDALAEMLDGLVAGR